MQMKSLAYIASLGMLAYSAAALPADSSQTQYIYVTNLLDNPKDAFPARTQTPVKIEAYQDSKVCFVWTLNFGDMYKFTGAPNDPNCTYISQLVVTPLPVNKAIFYRSITGGTNTTIPIPGGTTKYAQVTIVAESAPVLNSDGSLAVQGMFNYQFGVGFKAQ